MHNIYKITNAINNKIYIGQTVKPIEHRMHQHILGSSNPKYKLHRAINKYGSDVFQIEIIQKCQNKTEADETEKHFIQLFNSTNDDIGYNIAPGGQGGDIKTSDQKLELSKKMRSDNPMYKIKSDENVFNLWKTNVSKGTKIGQKRSPKHALQQIQNRKRMIENNPNQMNNLSVRQKLSASQKKRYRENPELRRFGEDNPMFERSIFHEQSIEWQNEQRKQRSRCRLQEVYRCPFCQRTIKTTANFYKHCRSIHNKTEEDIDYIKTKRRDCEDQPSKPVSLKEPNTP